MRDKQYLFILHIDRMNPPGYNLCIRKRREGILRKAMMMRMSMMCEMNFPRFLHCAL